MAKPRRILRLQQLILETAASHIQGELEDPRIGLISITRVKLAPDLSHAQIFWSALGDETTVRTCERGLTNALPSIQRAVAHALQTRVTPKLQFRHDPGMVHAERIETIFAKLRAERGDIEDEVEEDVDENPEEDVDGSEADPASDESDSGV